MRFQLIYLTYGFTGFSIVQLIGYLGTAYTWLKQPMTILFLVLILLALILGIAEWTLAQSKQDTALSSAKILSCFSGSLTLILLLIFAMTVGVWIVT